MQSPFLLLNHEVKRRLFSQFGCFATMRLFRRKRHINIHLIGGEMGRL